MIEIDTTALSPMAAHIVDLVGLDAALRLFGRFGGVRVYIPVHVEAAHALAHLLGLDAAQALSGHYAGEYIDIPQARAAVLSVRNNRMRAAYAHGVSARDLALEHRMSERQVYNIVASSRTINDAQPSLF